MFIRCFSKLYGNNLQFKKKLLKHIGMYLLFFKKYISSIVTR